MSRYKTSCSISIDEENFEKWKDLKHRSKVVSAIINKYLSNELVDISLSDEIKEKYKDDLYKSLVVNKLLTEYYTDNILLVSDFKKFKDLTSSDMHFESNNEIKKDRKIKKKKSETTEDSILNIDNEIIKDENIEDEIYNSNGVLKEEEVLITKDKQENIKEDIYNSNEDQNHEDIVTAIVENENKEKDIYNSNKVIINKDKNNILEDAITGNMEVDKSHDNYEGDVVEVLANLSEEDIMKIISDKSEEKKKNDDDKPLSETFGKISFGIFK